MSTATAVELSFNDLAIVQTLFDREGVVAGGVKVIPTASKYSSSTSPWAEREERLAIRLLNKEQPGLDEIHESISKLSGIISNDTQHASAYNNRAQATRLLFRIEDFCDHPAEIRSIMIDLTMAISYATPPTSAAPVSEKDVGILSSAHTHRGYLLWLASRRTMPEGVFSNIDGLEDLTKDQLEEFASREFAMGGRYGNKAARELSVRTNPYAKLCGEIVKEALRKEISDHYGVP